MKHFDKELNPDGGKLDLPFNIEEACRELDAAHDTLAQRLKEVEAENEKLSKYFVSKTEFDDLEIENNKLTARLALAEEILVGALAETSRTTAKPISMTDALIQLSEIETRCDKALAKWREGRGV